MDTPGPERPLLSTIYGAYASRINRRALFGCGLLLPLAARAAGIGSDDLAVKAIIAMGGRDKLARVKALQWDGRATISTGIRDNLIEISVQTRVEPFVRARSRSWITRQGSWHARTMLVERDRGTVEQYGTVKPLPAAQALHEHHQFAIYGYLLLAQSALRVEGAYLLAEHDGLPPIRFTLGVDGRPNGAEYRVASPEGGTVEERLIFEGRARSPSGVAWPERIKLLQKDFDFDLTIDAFDVEIA